MALIGLSPPSAQEKDFPAVCTAVASEHVCPHIPERAVFHTDEHHRGIGQCERWKALVPRSFAGTVSGERATCSTGISTCTALP